MKMFSRVDANLAVQINQQFPGLNDIRQLGADGGMQVAPVLELATKAGLFCLAGDAA